MSDHHDETPSNGNSRPERRPRLDADKGREPQLIPGQLGTRWFSLNALVEHVEAAFIEEHGDDSPELLEADTLSKRLKLVLATADYVLSVESAQVSRTEKADIINRVYSSLFGYGPLDALFLDERVTTISLEGADKASVRYGYEEFALLGTIFQSEEQLRRSVKRLLIDAGAELRDDQPYIETGLKIGKRPVSINLIQPPAAFQLSVDIRVHPAKLRTADDLIASDFMTPQAADLLRALAESSHGLMIVGESESGKTTLLSVLSAWLPESERIIAVERAGELRLPPAAQSLMVKWPVADQPGVSFAEQVENALALNPSVLMLDEVRTDEANAVAPLLEMPDAPRQLWSFRGAIFAKRLGSALGMLARRADFGGGEERVRALYERLPFVVAISRVNGALRLWSIAEWQFKHSLDYPTYTLLLNREEGELKLTGERPVRDLKLSDNFWG